MFKYISTQLRTRRFGHGNSVEKRCFGLVHNILDMSIAIWTRPKQFGLVQNSLGLYVEGQGISNKQTVCKDGILVGPHFSFVKCLFHQF